MTTTTTTELPTWDDLTDVDKGAALLHMWKRSWEGASYAVDEYPCRYFDHPALTALDTREASRHAAKMCGSHEQMVTKLGDEEHDRLYDLAREEPDRRRLWAARRLPTNIYPVDGAERAHELLVIWAGNDDRDAGQKPPPASWKPADRSAWAVLHRAEWGGEWHEAGGCDGCKDAAA